MIFVSHVVMFVKNQQIGKEVAKVQMCPRGENTALTKEDKLHRKYELLQKRLCLGRGVVGKGKAPPLVGSPSNILEIETSS